MVMMINPLGRMKQVLFVLPLVCGTPALSTCIHSQWIISIPSPSVSYITEDITPHIKETDKSIHLLRYECQLLFTIWSCTSKYLWLNYTLRNWKHLDRDYIVERSFYYETTGLISIVSSMSMGVVYTRGTINKNVMTTDHRYTEGGKRRFPGG